MISSYFRTVSPYQSVALVLAGIKPKHPHSEFKQQASWQRIERRLDWFNWLRQSSTEA